MPKEYASPPIVHLRDALAAAIDLVTAADLVGTGDLDKAESLLWHDGKPPSSPAALDLLARIAVRRGQFSKARQLWTALLQKDETNHAARRALATLDSPWLIWGLIRRLGFLAAVALLLVLSAIGLWNLLGALGRKEATSHSDRPVTPRTVAAQSSTPVAAPALPLAPSTNESTPRMNIAARPPETAETRVFVGPPYFTIQGFTVLTNDLVTTIQFEGCMFPHHDEMSDSARERLRALAEILATDATGCWILVEGRTDPTPLSPNSRFRDNFSLGLQRAVAVVEVMRSVAPDRAMDMLASSASDAGMLPATTGTQQCENGRTAMVRLLRKPDATGKHGEGRNESTR